MAKKDFVDSRRDELDALSEVEGVDAKKLLEQAGLKPDNPDEPPADPPEDPPGTPPETPPGEPPADPPEDPPGTPPDTPPDTPPADPPPGPDALNEIFGDTFKTLDEAKAADIPGQLQELATLRQEKTDLEAKLEAKPKTNFANDEVALFNEFVKETGVKDYGVFNSINATDIESMDDMEALVKVHILKNPNLAGSEADVKKYFEKKYNVDPDQVEPEELRINKIGLSTDGGTAKKELLDLKSKLKVPEPEEETPPSRPQELTPEAKETLQTGWGQITDRIGKELGSISIPMKGSKEPLTSYKISDELMQAAVQDAVKYCVENRMEFNEENVSHVAGLIFNRMLVNELPNITHSVFEKARSLTEEEVAAMYENPSPSRNNDQPPGTPPAKQTDAEKIQDDLFNAEMERG